jgi:alpha-beta hydrolase superfamily lysophospholipase
VQPRPLFSLWANFYNSMGFAVLNYDKRGTGESGGSYPGEAASSENLSIYADDAVAAARFLQRQPEVDRTRVGLHGGSQGGWVLPIALERAPDLAFGILASGPAVTTSQQLEYKGFSGGSAYVPSISDAAIDADVRAITGGYDPMPALRALHVPTIWVYGEKDRQVPVRLSIENLHRLRGKDLTIVVLPGGWHGLTETPNGLEQEAAASKRFAPGLFTRIGDWLTTHHLTTTT